VYCALVASVSAFALQSGSVLPVRSSGSQPRRSSLTMAGNQMHAGTLGGSWTNDEIFAGALPKVVAFDLDATLWYPEMYQVRMRNFWNNNTHVMHCSHQPDFVYLSTLQLWGGGAPFKKNSDGTLTDKSGTTYVCENAKEKEGERKRKRERDTVREIR